jgi:PD-(D/E)XK nuclease superfamily
MINQEDLVIDVTPQKTNVVFDATLLTALMGCARYTDLRYNHRFLPIAGPGNSLELGLMMHKILEVYYKNIIKGYKKDVAAEHAIMAGHLYVSSCKHCTEFKPSAEVPVPLCGHQINEYPGLKNTPVDSEGKTIGWRYALHTAEEYFAKWRGDSWIPLEVEIVKGKVIYEDDNIRILWKSKFDLIMDTDNGIRSIDHKTMKQRRDILELNNQFMGQCLVLGTKTVFINRIGFQTTLKPEEKFTRNGMSFSEDKLDEFRNETVPYYAYRLLEYNETGHWPPNYTHCETKYGVCMYYQDVCNLDRKMREDSIRAKFFVGPEWNPTNEEND